MLISLSFHSSPPGASNGVVLHQGAVGVDVFNNYIHGFGFAGIRCGDYISYQGDCMLSNIFYNSVFSPRANATGDADAAGIYYNTHWINPGGCAKRRLSPLGSSGYRTMNGMNFNTHWTDRGGCMTSDLGMWFCYILCHIERAMNSAW